MSLAVAIGAAVILSVALIAGCVVIHVEAVRAFERGETP
jgi:hypothetical protein